MRILLTGASGFIGQHFLKQIFAQQPQSRILALGRSAVSLPEGSQFIATDLNQISQDVIAAIKAFAPTVCVHLAWQGIPDYSLEQSLANLQASTQFLEQVLTQTDCKKIVVTGSCAEYGRHHGACQETDPLTLRSHFAWAKESLRQWLTWRCQSEEAALIWLRLFYVYGPGQREGALIPGLTRALKQGQSPDVRTPQAAHDFVQVTDVARHLVHAVYTSLPAGIYNLGTGQVTEVQEICQQIIHALGGEPPATAPPAAEAPRFWADLDKTRSHFDCSSLYTIEQGISEYLRESSL